MANNFRVNVLGGDMKRLNLKILGDFDGTSAFRLLNFIEKKGGLPARSPSIPMA